MMMKLTRDTARTLAAHVAQARRDAGIDPTWDPQGIYAALSRCTDRGDIVEVTAAALRCALNPKIETPAVIAMDGPHWQTPATVHELRPRRANDPIRPDERCPVDGHEHPLASHCAACRAEWLETGRWPDGSRHVEVRRLETRPQLEPDHAMRAAGDGG